MNNHIYSCSALLNIFYEWSRDACVHFVISLPFVYNRIANVLSLLIGLAMKYYRNERKSQRQLTNFYLKDFPQFGWSADCASSASFTLFWCLNWKTGWMYFSLVLAFCRQNDADKVSSTSKRVIDRLLFSRLSVFLPNILTVSSKYYEFCRPKQNQFQL